MKFVFYYDSKKGKKKQQVIKAKSKEDLKKIVTIAKCELTKRQLLKDIDYFYNNLICETGGKRLSMKELYNFMFNELDKFDNKKSKKDKDKKSSKKDKKKKKKDSKNKLKKSQTKNNDKFKMSFNDFNMSKNNKKLSTENGLVKITRRR